MQPFQSLMFAETLEYVPAASRIMWFHRAWMQSTSPTAARWKQWRRNNDHLSSSPQTGPLLVGWEWRTNERCALLLYWGRLDYGLLYPRFSVREQCGWWQSFLRNLKQRCRFGPMYSSMEGETTLEPILTQNMTGILNINDFHSLNASSGQKLNLILHNQRNSTATCHNRVFHGV